MNDNSTAGPTRGAAREWADLPEWITTQEAAEISGYDIQHVRRLARQSKIGAVKKGRDWWIDRDVFKAYFEKMKALGTRRHDPRGPDILQSEPTEGRGS